jgi:hypothetical protein
MIDIFLNGANNGNKAVITTSGIDYNYVIGTGSTQKIISTIFLLLALACAPIMLCVKPLILKK